MNYANEIILCPRCGARSALMCNSVEDYYFGFGGKWDVFECSGTDCGIAWPMPFPDDATLASAYRSYYTHETKDNNRTLQRIRTYLTKWLHQNIEREKFYKGIAAMPIVGQILEDCFWSSGGISPNVNGTVLDIGCGSGDRLQFFLSLGWGKALGVDPDQSAVKAGVDLKRIIRLGSAEKLPFATGAMDAAVMHHVIEHVRNPNVALAEAFRVLKPGTGQLVVITPNVTSLMRKQWAAHWRGFEVPRHLTIFSVPALQTAVVSAGFHIEASRTSARSAAWINRVSREAAGIRPVRGSLFSRLYTADKLYKGQHQQIRNGLYVGDEIVVVARKPDAPTIVKMPN